MANTRKATIDIPARVPELRRSGKNVNGYLGERIDIAAVLRSCVRAALVHGWNMEEIPVKPWVAVPAFMRLHGHGPGRSSSETTEPSSRIYISSGIHGDEPAGPLAIQQLLEEDDWPEWTDLWICPCINPTGFANNTRESSEGLDLNRQYRGPSATETIAHVAWLERQPSFDLALCVHEDWESDGFYVYELNPENRPSVAEAIIESVARVCPVEKAALIEGRPAREGIIRPSLDPRSRPDWPEAFYLITHKTRLSYTLEAPSDFSLQVRVSALVAAIRAALERFSQRR